MSGTTSPPGGAADAARLAALDAYAILDTPPERGFDDIVHLARRACDAPVALISLVAGDRQWFKSRAGFEPCQTDLNASVCAHVLGRPGLLVIPDLALDPRTTANPLVTGSPHLRFYAGAPLHTPDGVTLGALCVIDHAPRPGGLTPAQAEDLEALARQVMTQLELRRALAERQAGLHERDAYSRTRDIITGSGGDLDAILDALVAGAMEAVPAAESGVLELIDGAELEYRAVRGSLAPHRGLRVPLLGSTSGTCASTGTAILITDARADPRVRHALAEHIGLRSAVLAPVTRGSHVLGVLKLQSSRPAAFGQHDLQRVRLFAGAATAGLTEVREVAAQRAVRVSEARYRAVFESAIDYAIVVMDLDGRVTDWNAGATRILGWTPDEVRGRPADLLFTPEDRAADIAGTEMRGALAAGRGIDERWHVRKGGARFWASGEMMALRDAGGTAIGFVKFLRDRTEQRRQVEALRRQGELLQTITDHVGQAVFQMDAQGDVTFANPAAAAMFGWPAAALVGRNLHATLHHSRPDGTPYPAQDCAFVCALRDGQRVLDREEVFFRRDGTPVRVQVTTAPVSIDGAVTSAVLTVSDITARKVAERALAESEARWRGLFEGMQEGFFIGELIRDAAGAAADYRLLIVNPAFETQSGLPQHGATGRTLRELVPGIQPWLIDAYAHVIETGEPATFEIEVPDLGRWFEVRASREAAERVAVLFLDVTARKVVEARQAALLDLGDGLRDVDDQGAIIALSARIAGETLGLVRAGYGAVDPERETIVIAPDWHAPGLASIAGPHRFRDYGSYIEALKRGETVVVDDAITDPRTALDADMLAAIDARAFVNIPLMERGRFVAVIFLVAAGTRPWTPDDIAFLRSLADRTRAAIARVEAEAQQRLLNHELSHRMKNLLAMVQSIATQTMRGAADVETAKEVLAGRLIALGKAHDLLMGGTLASTRMEPVIRGALEVHADRADRFRLDGPDIEIGPDRALSLALMLHELATNAGKYGALSGDHGHVTVSWAVDHSLGEARLRLSWVEAGGPPVQPPTRKGFGSRFIERGLVAQVGGELVLAYPPSGVTCTLSAPLAAFRADPPGR